MALRPDRDYAEVTDISNFWSEVAAQNTQEKGGIACVETAGSGVALDDVTNVVQYADSASGAVPKGVLLQDVNPPMSTTRDFKNFANMEVRPGEKVTLLRKGWLVTDMIDGTPVVGGGAYVGSSGLISATSGTASARIGRWETTLDADGFAKVYIDI
jgi:hypothetical protein